MIFLLKHSFASWIWSCPWVVRLLLYPSKLQHQVDWLIVPSVLCLDQLEYYTRSNVMNFGGHEKYNWYYILSGTPQVVIIHFWSNYGAQVFRENHFFDFRLPKKLFGPPKTLIDLKNQTFGESYFLIWATVLEISWDDYAKK